MREIDLKLVIPTRHDAFCPPRAAPRAARSNRRGCAGVCFDFPNKNYLLLLRSCYLLIVNISELIGFCSFDYILALDLIINNLQSEHEIKR